MKKKYIYHRSNKIYAIYYSSNKTMYINLNFTGTTQLIIKK